MKFFKKNILFKVLLAVLTVIVVLLLIKYIPKIIELTTSPEKFRSYIFSLGHVGILVFIFFQMLQVVIAPIPGEIIQVAGGYIYGTAFGTFYSTLGMMLGSIVVFYFTRFIGASFMENLLKKPKFKWLTKIMHSNKLYAFMLVMFAVPGLPKDFIVYFAGLTPVKASKFFIILLLGRLPWLIASVYIGASVQHKNYTCTIAVSLIALIALILGLMYKDKLINKFSKSNA